MKLSYLAFDAMLDIPGGRLFGAEMTGDITESTFRASDGWDLRRVEKGVFTVQAAHMPVPLTIESSECRYFTAPPEPAPVVEVQKGKKR